MNNRTDTEPTKPLELEELPELKKLVDELGLHQPTAEQAAVATYPATVGSAGGTKSGAPLLVVAGAGSGKTNTLGLRAIYLVATGQVESEHILGLTFTRKAAAELVEHLQQQLESLRPSTNPLFARTAQATTYNSFALSIVQEFGSNVGLDPQVGHLGEAAAWQLMSEVVAEWDQPLSGENSEQKVVDSALGLRDAIASQALTLPETKRALQRELERFEQYADARTGANAGKLNAFHARGQQAIIERIELLQIIEKFDERKAEAGLMDYADQVTAAIKVVEGSPEAKQELRDRHRVVFLDEFQDTSVGQMRLLSALFHDHSVTAVGDPNQAIYGWRGASAASLQDFHPMFNKSGVAPATVLNLSTAWRNDQSILDAANKLVEPLKGTPSWQPHVSGVKQEQSVPLPQLRARKNAGPGKISVNYAENKAAEIRGVVDFVQQTRKERGDGVTVAVLARRWAPLRAITEALREAEVPTQIVGGEALLLHPTVVDLRSVLEISNDIGKSKDLLRLLVNLDLGVYDLRVLGDLAREVGYSAPQKGDQERVALLLEGVHQAVKDPQVKLSAAARVRLGRLAKQLVKLRSAQGSGLVMQVEQARAEFNLDADALADPAAESITDVLDQFTSVARDYENSVPHPTMSGFLTWLEVAQQKERGLAIPGVEVDPDAVQVMTVHASKGLEWDAVAVVDMEMSRFPAGGTGAKKSKEAEQGYVFPPYPARQSGWWTDLSQLPYPARRDHQHLPDPNIWDPDQTVGTLEEEFRGDVGDYLEGEERRLAYVAVTRARRHLHLAGSWYDTGVTPLFPSPYLEEVAQVLDDELSGRRSTATIAIEPQPTVEEAETLIDAGAAVDFPRQPGPQRRRNEQAAAEVQERIREVDGLPYRQVAAGMADQQVAQSLVAYLDHYLAEQSEAPGLSLDSDPAEILETVLKSRPLSVTDVANYDADPEETAKRLLRPVPTEPHSASLVGTIFHQWVEGWLKTLGAQEDDEKREVPTPELAALAREDAEQIRGMISAFEEGYPYAGMEVVGLEVPFQTSWKDGVLRGRVDAVFRDEEGNYLLVDWKTARRLPKSLGRNLERYHGQLAAYRDAWQARAAAEGVEIRAELFFVAPHGTMRVDFDQIVGDLQNKKE